MLYYSCASQASSPLPTPHFSLDERQGGWVVISRPQQEAKASGVGSGSSVGGIQNIDTKADAGAVVMAAAAEMYERQRERQERTQQRQRECEHLARGGADGRGASSSSGGGEKPVWL